MTVPGNLSSPLLATAAAAAAAAAGPTRSLRFNDGDSAHLSRTPSSAGNRKTFTIAFWAKRTEPSSSSKGIISARSSGNGDFIRFSDDGPNNLRIYGDGSYDIQTTRVFRDVSAWYHFVIAFDTTQATAADRIKLYINGVEEEDLSSTSYPSQNADTRWNSTIQHDVGRVQGTTYMDGYLCDIYMIDGSQLNATSFGAFDDNGVWQAAAYSGTFGTNGFHLDFSDATNTTTIGEDSSGNNNDFTASNISVSAGSGNDSLFDSPLNGSQSDSGAGGEVSGNYPVLNPFDKSSGLTLSNCNLDLSTSSGNNNFEHVRATVGITSGKWYCEYTATNGRFSAGVATQDSDILDRAMGDVAGSFGIASDGTNVYKQGFPASSHSNLGNTDLFSTNDVCGIAFDADNGTLDFYKNGSAVTGAGYTGLSTTETWFFVFGDSHNGSPEIAQGSVNFGQRAFSNSAPSNYKPLCTALFPTPTIADGSAYFQTKLFTGTGASNALTMSNSSMSPDWVWIKERSTSGNHELFDAVRGANKILESDGSNAEATVANTLTSFDSNGFTLGTSSLVNDNNVTYAAWCWDAGSSTVSNTDGSGTSSVQVRANTTAGFSIVTYTGGSSSPANSDSGDSFGHGLGVAPDLVICKKRTGSNSWPVYHRAAPTGALILNATNANDSTSFLFAKKDPTSTEVFLGNNPEINNSSHDYVAYCFAPVAGYSAFGSYEGNGSFTDGPFIHLGFRPAFFLLKSVDSTYNWHIIDSARSSFNPVDDVLRPNLSNSEVVNYGGIKAIFCANGIKLNANWLNVNNSGDTFVYAAFAENPFQANGGLAR